MYIIFTVDFFPKHFSCRFFFNKSFSFDILTIPSAPSARGLVITNADEKIRIYSFFSKNAIELKTLSRGELYLIPIADSDKIFSDQTPRGVTVVQIGASMSLYTKILVNGYRFVQNSPMFKRLVVFFFFIISFV